MSIDEFRLERYRYVLQQKRSLNSNTFIISAAYQSLLVGASGAQAYVLSGYFKGDYPLEFCRIASWSIYGLFSILSFFIIAALISGIIAWARYRKEEKTMNFLGDEHASEKNIWSGFFGWYETYFIAAVIIILICYWQILKQLIFPSLV